MRNSRAGLIHKGMLPSILAFFGAIMLFSISAQAAVKPSGEDIFHAKCVLCHGADGSGNTPVGKRLKVADLRSPQVQKLTDAQLYAIISDGKGGKMPPFKSTISSPEIHELIAYIRKLGKK